MPYTLQFEAAGVNRDSAIIHDNDSFRVQWNAENLGPDITLGFTDWLKISEIPEGCPGSDLDEHPVVYDSAVDGDAADLSEPELLPGEIGPLLEPLVGPFAAGSYRRTVTFDDGGPNPVSLLNCIEIVEATN
jgi:hypothetical protein